ncbi:BEL1-like homeodomain protein 6 [Raphanus sativus]|uniref:BEL1-like homeodomain protein 6 n=1 Tax=Raphanus sativus TaxID=3726 RepID=A0A9W3D0U0_RAPSA|nr:BEL1-like homeodomain protein 6 [Raphanus sativus]XP_056856616.1 BEL1-like homeodomain protein 6 [Raphanus sativus]XP_056856617.1 BEL1-like homeodomain protein 6 [Raphanus sativus]XP_056857380.1 BEL1-like homeodomain protein 6 [Raphanus sativus]XP_056857381.1 BEL1-like homeodomain protein 6 [Raphanus sativus]XP_056857382.1 BEL1-like homeodomain protein 6 [Raphanus sativus]KAJ4866613.1 BEL1-like homeodomain protein 6 [Raphanus sativus]KAJ4867382.1 BEL1-like homeodomain protein 6 [Raphanus 
MENYQEARFPPGNAMIHMNPTVSYSEEVAGRESTEANNVSASQERQVYSRFGGVSQMQDIQDFGSWRDQASDRSGFHLMSPIAVPTGVHQTGQGLSLSLGSQILPAIHQMNHQRMVPREEHCRGNEYATQSFPNVDVVRTIPNSKYLKAAQQLLDEAVNVKKSLKQFQPEGDKNKENPQEPDQNPQDSSTNPPAEISQSEKQEMHNKLTKLLSMLDEVDRRYKQYYQQMQIVVSSFDVIAGYGAAKPYTALALQTISRHFRSLRDAISGQIIVTRKCLGEQDGSDGKGVGVISRLKYVDQHLRQQRGFMQPQAWRPQRGLPENSVLILRAWLFEHFLHPYPKDSDKIMLARQTGLSRGQVSNWFINARVRLWKPMVEEIYKEEFTENDSNSSSENTPKMSEVRPIVADDEDPAQEFPQDRTKPDHEHGYGVETCGIVQGGHQMDGGRFMTVEPSYHVAEISRFGGGGVSLTLGLQNSQGRENVVAMSSEAYNSFPGVGIYGNVIPGAEMEYVNPESRQNRITSSQLVHDFVA